MIFLTSIDRVFVPQHDADELLERLGDDPAAAAIRDADDRGVRLSADEKRAVLAVLEQWTDPGTELGRLRYELVQDLK